MRLSASGGAAALTAVLRLTARRAARSGAGWGAVFGTYVAVSALGYASAYPTPASRAVLARSLGSNSGLAALLGPARQIDTVAGFTAWRCLGVLTMVGAVWGLLTATRLLRGEEDAGRWELLLAGQTTPRRAALQALGGVATGWAALLVVTAAITVAAGRRADPPIAVADALFLSLCLTASAALFLTIGAVASQLATSRRQAAGLAAAVFGAAVALRIVADSGPSPGWLRWATPLGWVEELHPMTGAQPVVLVLIVGTVAALALFAARLAGSRDLAAGVLPPRDRARARLRLLSGPWGLVVQLERGVAMGWIAGIGALGLLLGLVARSAADAASGSAEAQRILGRLGAPRFDARAYLGVAMIIVATLVCLMAAGQLAATREEEAEGRLDNLVARPLGPGSWLVRRVVVSGAVVTIAAMTAGVLAWLGTALQGAGVGLGVMLEAALNIVPPALFLLGAGTLVHAALPRLVGRAAYGLVAWSFLAQLVGSLINAPGWLIDTSLFSHMAPAPAADPDWTGNAILTGLGVAAAVAALRLFQRRDLEPA